MKKSFTFITTVLAVSLIFTHTMAQAGKPNCIIKGTFRNIPGERMPSTIYLYYVENGQRLDSATVVKGAWHFKQTLDGPTRVRLTAVRSSYSDAGHVLYLDKGVIDIVSDPSFENTAVTGSGSQADRDYNEATIHTRHLLDSLNALAATEAYKKDADLRAKVQSALLGAAFNVASNEKYAFVKNHPGSPIAPEIVFDLSKAEYLMSDMLHHKQSAVPIKFPGRDADSLLAMLPPASQALAKKKIGDFLEQRREADLARTTKEAADEAKTAPGAMAPDFTQNDVNGKPVTLSSFRGKYVLVDFWASWCKPCREENPNVVRVYEKYKDKGLAILGVSLDGIGKSNRDAWQGAIQKDGLAWTQVSDLKGFNNEVAVLYGVTAIPQNFLVGPDGKIVGRNLQGEDLDKKLSGIFKN